MSFQPPFRVDFVRNARLEAEARAERRPAQLAADHALRGRTGVRCGFGQMYTLVLASLTLIDQGPAQLDFELLLRRPVSSPRGLQPVPGVPLQRPMKNEPLNIKPHSHNP